MADLGSLSDVVQIVSASGGALIGLFSAYWKWVVVPRRAKVKAEEEFKDGVLKAIASLELGAKNNKDFLEEALRDVSTALKNSDAYEQKEIEELKQDLKDLAKDMNDHISRVDSKNEKLLDLIIKYFTEKD